MRACHALHAGILLSSLGVLALASLSFLEIVEMLNGEQEDREPLWHGRGEMNGHKQGSIWFKARACAAASSA